MGVGEGVEREPVALGGSGGTHLKPHIALTISRKIKSTSSNPLLFLLVTPGTKLSH